MIFMVSEYRSLRRNKRGIMSDTSALLIYGVAVPFILFSGFYVSFRYLLRSRRQGRHGYPDETEESRLEFVR